MTSNVIFFALTTHKEFKSFNLIKFSAKNYTKYKILAWAKFCKETAEVCEYKQKVLR